MTHPDQQTERKLNALIAALSEALNVQPETIMRVLCDKNVRDELHRKLDCQIDRLVRAILARIEGETR